MDYVCRCLKSVLSTNYPNFEIIFVDNASTYGSLECLTSSHAEACEVPASIRSKGCACQPSPRYPYPSKKEGLAEDYCLFSPNFLLLISQFQLGALFGFMEIQASHILAIYSLLSFIKDMQFTPLPPA
jgi:GT2 family glycosyltransferase